MAKPNTKTKEQKITPNIETKGMAKMIRNAEESAITKRNRLLENLGNAETYSAQCYRDYLKARGVHQEAERKVNEARKEWQEHNQIFIPKEIK